MCFRNKFLPTVSQRQRQRLLGNKRETSTDLWKWQTWNVLFTVESWLGFINLHILFKVIRLHQKGNRFGTLETRWWYFILFFLVGVFFSSFSHEHYSRHQSNNPSSAQVMTLHNIYKPNTAAYKQSCLYPKHWYFFYQLSVHPLCCCLDFLH